MIKEAKWYAATVGCLEFINKDLVGVRGRISSSFLLSRIKVKVVPK